MGITERRLRQKEEVRSSILSTAWRMVKEEGWQSPHLAQVCGHGFCVDVYLCLVIVLIVTNFLAAFFFLY